MLYHFESQEEIETATNKMTMRFKNFANYMSLDVLTDKVFMAMFPLLSLSCRMPPEISYHLGSLSPLETSYFSSLLTSPSILTFIIPRFRTASCVLSELCDLGKSLS